jgi:hypothetical protein
MNARSLRIAGLLGFVALWICENVAAAPEARAWLDRNSMPHRRDGNAERRGHRR